MKVLFMGTPDFAGDSLRALIARGIDVVGVFTQPDKPVGRKRIIQKPPVKVIAEEVGISVYQPAKLRDGNAIKIISELEPDLIAVVAYGKILPKEILHYPRFGCVNIHGSILPKYRGAAPIQWAVINGDKETGVTAMYMEETLDTGDIIESRTVEIPEGETAGELFCRLAPVGADLLCDTIRNIERGEVKRTPQSDSAATYAPPLTREDAIVDWNSSGKSIVSKVNGLNPWPIAEGVIKGTKFKIYKASFLNEKNDAVCGTPVSADERGIAVACADGVVMIEELQAPGGKRMSAVEYLRGHPLCW